MRIGLNLLFLLPGKLAGIASYAINLVNALARLDSHNEYYLFVNRETRTFLDIASEHSNFTRVACNVNATYRPMRLFWEQLILPFQLRWNRIDLVHSLGYFSPLLLPCKSVTTIPDLNYINARSSFTFANHLLWSFMVPLSAKRSDRVITISESSKNDIISSFHIPTEKVQVVYLSASDSNCLDSPSEDLVDLSQYGILGNPILSVASSHPHKNLPRLIKAYNCLVESKRIEHQLVLVGHHCSDAKSLQYMIKDLQLEGKVILTGYIPDNHLRVLYSRAVLFVFPSLYEGFGIPILEAMCHGIPTVCSRVASLPEVAGKAALFFDPYDVEDIASKVHRCLQDLTLRQELAHKGFRNIRRFSWKQTAIQTITVYEKVMGSVVPGIN
jgi:glycosyltransferase involved in cell wall biosynthesis